MSGSTPAYAFDASRYPRTYEPALGNRLIWVSFGCLLMAVGTWGGWYSFVAGDELGPKGPAVTISLSLTLVLLGGYLILSMAFSKIILGPDSVEIQNLLSKRTMLREEITARRFVFNTGTIELISRDTGKKKFKIALLTRPDALFTAWFESIPNLDAMERTKTETERFSVSSDYSSDTAQTKREINKTMKKPVVACLAGLFGILAAAYIYPPLDTNQMMGFALVIFFTPMVIHIMLAVRRRLARHATLLTKMYVGTAVGLLVLTAFVFLNGALDKHSPVQDHTRVTRKSVSRGRSGTTYTIFVNPSWRRGRVEERLSVSGRTFSNLRTGEPVRVVTHAGAFSLPWFSDVVPDE